MVVLSVLRPSIRGLQQVVLRSCIRSPTMIAAPNTMVVRNMASHKHALKLLPSRYEWEKFKDQFHFFAMLALIPMGLLITYVNIFIGPAELTDIPENYEPCHWEYYRGPIERFFARYVYESPEKTYERNLHLINEENEDRKFRLLLKKVKRRAYEHQDYKGWYYLPMDKNIIDAAKDAHEDTLEKFGTKGP